MADITQAQEARRQQALDRPLRSDGVLMSRKAWIDKWIGEGATVGIREGQRAIVKAGGGYYLESAVSKTGIDYAESIQPDYAAVTDRQFNASTGNSSLYS